MPTLALNYDNIQTELETLLDSLKYDTVKALEDYEQLYNNIAKGQERPDNATICNILRNAEKTADDLKDDIQWRINRDKMIEEYQSIPTLEAAQQQQEAALAKLCREWEIVKAKHQADCQPHEFRIAQIKYRLNELWRHDQLLKEGCRCEALKVGRDNVNFQRAKLYEERKILENKIHDLRYNMRQAQCVIDEKSIYMNYEMKKEEAKLIVADCQHEITGLQKQIDKLDVKIAEFDMEIERIESEMLLD